VALSVYFDASVIVALLVRDDDFNSRAEAFVRRHRPLPIVSDFASVEFASALARRVRMKDLTPAEARKAFQTFDSWKSGVSPAQVSSADLSAAETRLRRLDLGLRTADAIHIALARRLGADLVTFDDKMAASAKALGVKIVTA
jgi:predicted nucleic acid-binding protein